MQVRQCDVIGCAEIAAWKRTKRADDSLEDFLCNACWHGLCAKQPEQAARYTICNAKFASLHALPHCPGKGCVEDVVVIA